MSQPNVLILGIGNLLWADEGFGVRAIDAFHAQFEVGDNVTLMDGGTQGLYLVPYVQECDVLLVFDAVDYGLPPGTIKQVHGDEVPKFMGAKKMSLHQTGFQEVLATAELLGNYPEKVFLIGVQPEELEDYGGSLRDVVKAQIQPCLDIAVEYLKKLGVEVTAKPLANVNHEFAVNHPSLAMHQYENERPTPEQACRSGDERIITNAKYQFDPKPIDDVAPNLSAAPGQRLKP